MRCELHLSAAFSLWKKLCVVLCCFVLLCLPFSLSERLSVHVHARAHTCTCTFYIHGHVHVHMYMYVQCLIVHLHLSWRKVL